MEIEDKIIKEVCELPIMRRNIVTCRHCGKTKKIDNAKCMKYGYPKCCGYTMTIDDLDG